jgi:hypothetical protein
MDALTGFGFSVFFIVSLVVGLRLLLLWWRTRQLPELLIASGVLGIGSFGFAFAVVALTLLESRPGISQVLWGIAFLAMNLGGATTYVFTWTVFRRECAWAAWLTALAAAVFAGTWILEFFMTGFVIAGDPQQGLAMQASSWVRIGALGWGALESLRYYGLMRRRARLGLADAVVTNRFLLWGLGIGAAGWGSLVGLVVPLLTRVNSLEPGWLQLSSSLHGLVAAVAMWLAFVPPERYVRFVEARAAAVAEGPR